MCGIAGIFAYGAGAPPADGAALVAIRDAMAKRGPDGAGAWRSLDGRIALGHRRLSIIDLSDRAAQPMASDDGRLVVTFNGEIYNYRRLRADLEAAGVRFRTQSDTEVLLHLYRAKGEAMVADLRGMFAFAIWDAATGRMFLARDAYGIKPLYYADDGATFRFASQARALIAGGVSDAVDDAGLAGFCLFGSVPEPFTFYRAIRALPAGATMIVDHNGRRSPATYFSIASVFAVAPRASASDAECRALVAEAVRDSVAHHLVADVPVGVFLSAGIDSAAITGLAADLQGGADSPGRLKTATLAFAEFAGSADDEAPLAERVAAEYGTDHATRTVAFDEFAADLPAIFAAMDQPTIDGLNTWFVAKAARERGLKVALSGLGGDELFGGYPSFRDLPRWTEGLGWTARFPSVARGLRRLAAAGLELFGKSNPKAPALLEYGGTWPGAYLVRRGLFMPFEIAGLIGRERAARGLAELGALAGIGAALSPDPGSPFARVAALEGSLYMRNQLLRDTDWTSMAHSLEVRVPLVDPALLARLAPLLLSPGRPEGKAWLAGAPARPLPAEIAARPKTGFLTPIGRWIDRAGLMPPVAGRHAAGHWSRRWALAVLERFVPGTVRTA